MESNNNQRPFLSLYTGVRENKNGEISPYIYHGEGFITKAPSRHRAASGDKSAVYTVNVSITRNPWSILGPEMVKEEAENPSINEDKPFIELVAFGSLAERLNDMNIPPKTKVAFCGRPQRRVFTRKDGGEGHILSVVLDNIYLLATKNHIGDKPGNTIVRGENVYKGRNGEVKEQLVSLLAGTIKNVSAINTYNGRSKIDFDLELPVPAKLVHALATGTYQRGADYGNYRIIRVAIWGPRVSHMGLVLTPGNVVAVTGSTKDRNFNGQTYINMNMREISVLSWATPVPGANAADAPYDGAAPQEEMSVGSPAIPAVNEPDEDFGDLSELMDFGDEDGLPF